MAIIGRIPFRLALGIRCPCQGHGVLIIIYAGRVVTGALRYEETTTSSGNHVWKSRFSHRLFKRRYRFLSVCPSFPRSSGTPTHNNRCERFSEQGCTVYATSRTLETMDGFKHPVEKRVMDVTSDDDVKFVVQSILEEQGKIDIVVNNAGAISIGLSS